MASILSVLGTMLVGAGLFTWGYRSGHRDGLQEFRTAALETMHLDNRRNRYMLEMAHRVADTLRQAIPLLPSNSFVKTKASDVISEWDEHYL